MGRQLCRSSGAPGLTVLVDHRHEDAHPQLEESRDTHEDDDHGRENRCVLWEEVGMCPEVERDVTRHHRDDHSRVAHANPESLSRQVRQAVEDDEREDAGEKGNGIHEGIRCSFHERYSRRERWDF